MKNKLLFLTGLIFSGVLMASSDFRTNPEIVILNETPREKYPLKVSGNLPTKVELISKQEGKEERQPDFEFKKPFREGVVGKKKFEKVSDGWLVALDAGEWGAWLGWYSESGKEHYKISHLRVREFVRFYGHLYVIGGGCGGNAGKYGFLAKVSQESGVWHFEAVEMFPDCVLVMNETKIFFDRDLEPDFLILTSSLIYKWSESKGKDLLHGHLGWHDSERGTWRYKSPNSIAKDFEDNFFIGTDYGIIAILKNRGAREYPMGLKDFPPPPSNQEKEDIEQTDLEDLFKGAETKNGHNKAGDDNSE